MEWEKKDMTLSKCRTLAHVIRDLFEIPDLMGIYKGKVKTVFVLRKGKRTHRQLAAIYRAVAMCCTPMSYGLKGFQKWRAK